MTSALAVIKGAFLSFIFLFPLSNCQPFTLPFWSKRERGKNGAIIQMKEKKNNSQPSSFFYQLPSLLRQRKHLVPSVPPEKRGKKERSETLHPKCQWGQRGCQLPRTTRCWKTASLNEGCAFRKPSWWRSWLQLPKMAVLAWGKLHRCLYQTLLPLLLAPPVGLPGRWKRKANESGESLLESIRPKSITLSSFLTN